MNESFYIEALITGTNGKGVPGLEVKFSVVKSDTEEVIYNNNMIDIGKGCYKALVVFSKPSQYRLLIEPPDFYEDLIETIIVEQKTGRRIPL